MNAPASAIPAAWLDEIRAALAQSPRVLLGLAGTPGAGKSSLATALADAFGTDAVVVPMDGFHLANIELARLGRADRKGAPDTFDAAGFTALLARIRAAGAAETVYAPLFRREIEEPIANAIPVLPGHRLIITEGNYLLADGAWAGVRPLLNLCWFIDIAAEVRVRRLIDRHRHFGRSEDAARNWVLHSDEKNAYFIDKTRIHADRLVRWPAEVLSPVI